MCLRLEGCGKKSWLEQLSDGMGQHWAMLACILPDMARRGQLHRKQHHSHTYLQFDHVAV